MAFDIAGRFPDREWLAEMREKLDDKLQFAVKRAREVDFIPYTARDGALTPTDINWWTNGFWPALMWQMFRMTGRALYRDEAVRAEAMLDGALRNFKRLDHDMGFLWLIQSGVRWRIEGNADSYDRAFFAANMLAGRFNPHGFIRAWNNGDDGLDRAGWAIVDCMMNLPLLYWASETTGDPRYRLIAMAHADTTMKHFVRPDGSCNHIVIFDPQTGAFIDNPGGQGYEPGSSWSRGQSWALYGFTLSYLHTGKPEYLDTARRVADYFIRECATDWLPRCDFRQPAEPVIRDNAAGNIAACGLLELTRLLPEADAARCYDAAVNILMAQERDAADWTEETPMIFTKCTSAYHDANGRHIPMVYGDYFFAEAVGKLLGETLLFWYPNRERQE